MKRFISVMLCISMLAAFASCNASSTKEKEDENERIEEEEETDNEDEEEDEDETTSETSSEMSEFVPVTGDSVVFSTTDRDGTEFDNSIFADYELTMINFWEPWCGPCVGEMPDLEELYENYADQGLLIIGVYSEEGMESDVDEILDDSGITYPILRYTSEFDIYQSGYVPTTILVDRNGNIIDTGIVDYQDVDSTLIVGAHSYSEWERLVELYLGA